MKINIKVLKNTFSSLIDEPIEWFLYGVGGSVLFSLIGLSSTFGFFVGGLWFVLYTLNDELKGFNDV